MGPEEPTPSEVKREQQLERWSAYLAQLRTLVDRHAALAGQLNDLHGRYMLMRDSPDLSIEERRAQTSEIVRTEGEVLAQAQQVHQELQQLMRSNRRLLR